ncbi:MAG TPA: aspartate aminotransferase family protein [Flavobacteriaceae bacterium]|nr:aspartate aminotransferase family protein [Flavobacteriaceae bacterium]
MKDKFLIYQAQTSPHPLGVEVDYATGSYIYDSAGKKYLDFVAGVSACSLGHSHPKIVSAIKKQVDKYMHVMVYGEYAQGPAVEYAELLAENIPIPNAQTYLVNSGTEATEGALKLARRYTGREEIIAAKNAYHGNTMGSLSLMGLEERKKPFEPLIPEVSFIEFNSEEDLEKITTKTACVILETIQGGAGFIVPTNDYLQKVKTKCEETGALLILDEIQPGFGRTGKLFGYENYEVIPDIMLIGKGMAGGLPVGGFVARKELMKSLSDRPKMGHITTFGGNPVIAAAALATLKEILHTDLMAQTSKKEELFRKLLRHELIEEIRGKGLMLALILKNSEIANQLVLKANEKGLILFWLLFEQRAVRLTPPLTISEEEIKKGCNEILNILDELV